MENAFKEVRKQAKVSTERRLAVDKEVALLERCGLVSEIVEEKPFEFLGHNLSPRFVAQVLRDQFGSTPLVSNGRVCALALAGVDKSALIDHMGRMVMSEMGWS